MDERAAKSVNTASGKMGTRARLPLILVGVFLLLYVLPLGVRPLVIPDETRYAEIPREMVASGDWIVPRLNGLRYFEKPPLGYWATAAAIRLFGENAFAVRLPSAIAVGVTALLLSAWARRWRDDKAVPWLAVTVFLLCSEVLAVGTFCVLDSLLSLFVTAAIVGLYFAYEQQRPGTRMILLVLAGLACGLAFLTKGFLALAVPVIVIVPYASWQGRLRLCLRTAWAPLAVAGLVVLPWGILIHLREGDFWHYFFWVEHIDRFLSPNHGQHRRAVWYYVPMMIGGAMPWTVLVGSVAQGLRHTGAKNSMIRLAICWLVLPFLFFSASSGKLGTYILPCYPPLAFLIAVGVLQCLQRDDAKGFTIGAWVLILGACALLAGLVVGLFLVPQMSISVGLWKWAIAAAGLICWATLSRAAVVQKDVYKRLVLFSAAPVLFMFSWPFVASAAIGDRKAPGAFLLSNASRIAQNDILVAENGLAASACWCYKRSDVFIIGSEGEYTYGLSYEDSRHRVLDPQQFKDLIAGQAADKIVILVLEASRYAAYEPLLPSPSCKRLGDDLVWAEYPGGR
jgi:4-amino-4-deoxy-L-arabinose transferase